MGFVRKSLKKQKKLPNNYFQFKQFRIEQDKCAMKVSTDSCIFGAIVSPENAQHILDIGTGTALLALMLAQKSVAQIDAVEIDESAFGQACQNVENSIWRSKIRVFREDIRIFAQKTDFLYDLIVSNPPFFVNSTKSENSQKNLARHTDSLSFLDLIEVVQKLLTEKGTFAIILPSPESLIFEKLAEENLLFISEKYLILNQKGKKNHRMISFFKKNKENCIEKELIIKDGQNYTSDFVKLLESYYL